MDRRRGRPAPHLHLLHGGQQRCPPRRRHGRYLDTGKSVTALVQYSVGITPGESYFLDCISARNQLITKCNLVISLHGTIRREGRSVPLSPWHDVVRAFTPVVPAPAPQTYLPSSRNLSVSIRATDTLGASTTAKG